MKIAIVHDWLTVFAGAEKVLEQMLKLYPQAHLYCVNNHLSKSEQAFIDQHPVTTTFIQKLPFNKKLYRHYLPLMPFAIEQLDLREYDVVLSSSHAVAKGVLTSPTQIHISYVHSPMRYAWDLQHDYVADAKPNRLKRLLMIGLLQRLRHWDILTANRVDYFISNSNFVGKRIWRAYHREAVTIYPPVEVERFSLCTIKDDYYITASRLVPYKKVNLLIEAFRQMPERQLLIIGDGPQFKVLKKHAPKNVIFLGRQLQQQFIFYMQRAKAFLYAAEEDFGIALVEAQACGTPVIAYGKGGALETVKPLGEYAHPTGVLFEQQDAQSIIKAVEQFEQAQQYFDYAQIREHALQFSTAAFLHNLQQFIDGKTQRIISKEKSLV